MSKSRAERGNKTPSTNQNASSAANQNAIIPGKFTEYDWNDLVENESCEEFVSDIVNGIAEVAYEIIFQKIIEDRVPPYSFFRAKEILLDLIEWEFIQCDPGECVNTGQAWVEDDEPQACVTDSWAQGAVPVVASLNKLRSPMSDGLSPSSETATDVVDDGDNERHMKETEHDIKEITDDDLWKSETLNDSESLTDDKLTMDSAESSFGSSTQLKSQGDGMHMKDVPEKVSPVPPKEKKPSNRRTTFKTHKGSLPKFRAITMTPVTDDRPKPGTGSDAIDRHGAPLHSAESLFKHQHGRPPGIKEVVYDSNGNVIRVQKINISSLPDHRIRTKCSIGDPQQDSYKTSRKTKYNTNNYSNSSIALERNQIQNMFNAHETDTTSSLQTPLPPPLVDTIDVVEGVVIKEGLICKKGPKKRTAVFVEEQTLKPVQSGRGRSLDVHDIINKASPTLNSYTRSKPLPAILM